MPALDIPRSSGYSEDSDFPSRPSSYYECDSIDHVFQRIQAYNRNLRDMIDNPMGEFDDGTIINQGTAENREQQLKFHRIHGQNVKLEKGDRQAKRYESFCKGLAFSDRPIHIDENVCIRLCEISSNWSGVLRFGVTNIDPDAYRTQAVPKFACPDLTSKEGYWAKALPERYSVEGNILHFNVTATGELHYGVNGQSKGLFLMGINVSLPLWVIVDIYGNSQAVEFVVCSLQFTVHKSPSVDTVLSCYMEDSLSVQNMAVMPSCFWGSPDGSSSVLSISGKEPRDKKHPQCGAFKTLESREGALEESMELRNSSRRVRASSVASGPSGGSPSSSTTAVVRPIPSISALPAHESHLNGDVSVASQSNIQFHRMVGRHITLSQNRSVATRSEEEYTHGYVFTERPIANNEKITIQITKIVDLYHGGLAVGLTCRDPATLRGTDLPADSSDLVNFPEMFVGIKDVCNKPPIGTKLSFWVTDKGELKMQLADREERTLVFIDNSLQLYFYFDVYGSTQQIKLLGSYIIGRSRSPHTPRLSDASIPTHVALPIRPTTSRESRDSAIESIASNFSASMRLDSGTGTVTVRAGSERPPLPARRNVIEDLLTGDPFLSTTPLTPALAPLGSSGSAPSFHTASPTFGTRTPPPVVPRPIPPVPLRTPMPPPVSTIPSVPRRPVPIPQTAPPPPPTAAPTLPSFSSLASSSLASSSLPILDRNDERGECTVCMDAPINSVIYTCGHMCMCYECALQTKELRNACPICRSPMQDVIRIYKT